jgi:hypothetical protein
VASQPLGRSVGRRAVTEMHSVEGGVGAWMLGGGQDAKDWDDRAPWCADCEDWRELKKKWGVLPGVVFVW